MSPKKLLSIILGSLILIAGVCFGSYQLEEKVLIGRRGYLAAIPRDYREQFVEYRFATGAGAVGLFVVIAAGWAGVETLARTWQRQRNRELAQNAVLLKIAPRVDDSSKWQAAGQLWGAVHSTMARSGCLPMS